MKEGWILKRLFEVGSFQRGKSIQKVDFVNNGMPCIHYGQIHTSFGIATSQHISEISEELFSQSVIARTGDLLFALTSEDVEGSCKATAWMGYYDVAVSSDAAIFRHTLNPKFVSYFFGSKAFFRQKQKFARGFKVTHIKTSDVASFEILVPPLAEQERIVAELDLLTEIIDKQKAQLKELDTLAQSIFYDMFGDPVENDKGWDVKTFGEIGSVERGAGISKKDFVESGLPCIHYGQIHTTFGPFTTKHITCIRENLLPKYKIAHNGDLLMAITSEDVEGSCKSTAWLGDYDIAVGSDAAILHHSQNGIYLSFYTMTKAFYNEKAKYAKGFKVTHISAKEIESISVCLPPLSLQQSFADKINTIEQQKAAITQSIAETQKLFDYTMDKYFG